MEKKVEDAARFGKREMRDPLKEMKRERRRENKDKEEEKEW